MRRTDTVIVGGGQAGLAMSRCLSELGIDHVVLERGRIAERWRSERWDSLRLLTPNWMTRLPGHRYLGPDPDGFMTMPEVIDLLERYARDIDAPVHTDTTVKSVEPAPGGYRVVTDRGQWLTSNVVIATGYCDTPAIPDMAARLPREVRQIVPTRYRNPEQLPDGGVLVVGASASGIQLADEIHRSGRPVTLSVGRHTRLPRRYRGEDVLRWLDRSGILDETLDDVFDPEASKRQPSLQLVGRPDHETLDLHVLSRRGVRLVGRALAVEGWRVRVSEDLARCTAAADEKLARVLGRIDDYIDAAGIVAPPGERPPPVRPAPSPGEIDLRAEGIRTVLWATGFRRRYPWLKIPVLDDRGEIRHRGGVTQAPGLFVLGHQFLRRRKSSFIDGVGADAAELAHLVSHRDRVAA